MVETDSICYETTLLWIDATQIKFDLIWSELYYLIQYNYNYN